MINPEKAQEAIINASASACEDINKFSIEVLNTRGGRIGSGMGGLLEALWGYYVNRALRRLSGAFSDLELAWLYGHEYNDFACVLRNVTWNPSTREGEILRIETKSMVASADESKAHFDELCKDLGSYDLLTVLMWDWTRVVPSDESRVYPKILDHFIGGALPIAHLRDVLHVARGGCFVEKGSCVDHCPPAECKHVGEPLNASGRRERLSGPENARVSSKVSYAANFGGMVRMLKTGSNESRAKFRELRRNDETVHNYISFIHRNLPSEELNQYTAEEWRTVARLMGLSNPPAGKSELVSVIRTAKNYQDYLRKL